MPYNQEKLIETLKEMRNIYFKDPDRATRSQSFIQRIHEYCKHELVQKGIIELRVSNGYLSFLL